MQPERGTDSRASEIFLLSLCATVCVTLAPPPRWRARRASEGNSGKTRLQFGPAGAATDVLAANVPAELASIMMMFTARPSVREFIYISKQRL